MVNCGSQMQKD